MAGFPGAVAGQHDWVGSAVVQNAEAAEGLQAARIDEGNLHHYFATDEDVVQTRFSMRMEPVDPDFFLPGDATAAFALSTDNHLLVTSNGATVALTNTYLTAGTWTNFKVIKDYRARAWSLFVNNAAVFKNYPMSADQHTEFTQFEVRSDGTVPATYVDHIRIHRPVPSGTSLIVR